VGARQQRPADGDELVSNCGAARKPTPSANGVKSRLSQDRLGFMTGSVCNWLGSQLGVAEFMAEQASLLKEWEFAQANDWEVLEADPFKDELKASFEGTPEEEFAHLLHFANLGSVHCMNRVAWRYAVGKGVTEDLDQAQAWYGRAYEGGSDRGLLEYGEYLVWRDRIEEAAKVYEAGWQRDFVPAVYRLIRLRLRSTLPLKQRLAWRSSLEWAAAAGHPAARYLLSKYLLRGWFGVGGIPRGLEIFCAHLAGVWRGNDSQVLVG
jgi:TPR repeat protein